MRVRARVQMKDIKRVCALLLALLLLLGCACAEELERVIKYEGPDTVAAFIIEPIINFRI